MENMKINGYIVNCSDLDLVWERSWNKEANTGNDSQDIEQQMRRTTNFEISGGLGCAGQK